MANLAFIIPNRIRHIISTQYIHRQTRLFTTIAAISSFIIQANVNILSYLFTIFPWHTERKKYPLEQFGRSYCADMDKN